MGRYDNFFFIFLIFIFDCNKCVVLSWNYILKCCKNILSYILVINEITIVWINWIQDGRKIGETIIFGKLQFFLMYLIHTFTHFSSFKPKLMNAIINWCEMAIAHLFIKFEQNFYEIFTIFHFKKKIKVGQNSNWNI